VLFFGTYDESSHPRVAVLREGFVALGAEVTVLNEPLGLDTAERVSLLARPWLLPRLASRLARRWFRLWRGSRKLDRRPTTVLVGYLGHFDVLLTRRLFPGATIILDHLVSAAGTAQDRGLTSAWKDRLLRGLDERALSAASIPVVDTEEHLDALPVRHASRTLVVAVGAPTTWFDARPASRIVERQAVRVVFFGLFTPLQGATVIGRALAEIGDANISVTMIGRGQELAATRWASAGAQNVRWIDWVNPADLPAIVAAHDICLGIFGTTSKAQRVVPNKIYQGAAVGCALVSSDTPPQRRTLRDASVLVPPGDHQELARALRDLEQDRGRLRQLQGRAAALADERFRPAAVVRPLSELLRSTAPQ
jgi:glycosyltransferase involved in cell wall biosynthesis